MVITGISSLKEQESHFKFVAMEMSFRVLWRALDSSAVDAMAI